MNGEQSLMDMFSDPNTIHSLTFVQRMLGSTVTMIMGLGITFLILLLIWVFIAIMGRALEAGKKKEAPAAPAPAAAAAPAPAAPAPAATDDSLIAVISAAIAAYEGGNANNLVVRKITRLSGAATPWENAATLARMDTRKM